MVVQIELSCSLYAYVLLPNGQFIGPSAECKYSVLIKAFVVSIHYTLECYFASIRSGDVHLMILKVLFFNLKKSLLTVLISRQEILVLENLMIELPVIITHPEFRILGRFRMACSKHCLLSGLLSHSCNICQEYGIPKERFPLLHRLNAQKVHCSRSSRQCQHIFCKRLILHFWQYSYL